jgi:sugar phosphate isomerase/epimerase
MKLSRRAFSVLAAQAAACLGAGRAWADSAAMPLHELGLGIVIHSYGIRAGQPGAEGFSDPLVFFEYCRQLGAAGIQTGLGILDAAAAEKMRAAASDAKMYVEGIVALPKNEADVTRFTAELRTSVACGAQVVRTVMLSGRRYETFTDLASFQAFARESFQRLQWAKPAMEATGVRLAVENHKDWRTDELLDILRRIDCPLVGVCVDTGNSIALLEEPHEVIDAYAPVAFTSHFKDKAVQEYADGFLLSEVPLGQGILDLKRIVQTLRAKQPEIRLNLEMITRDPLRVPCLTAKYWATFEQLPASVLAAALRRLHTSTQALPGIDGKSVEEKLRFEDNNVRESLAFAAWQLTK